MKKWLKIVIFLIGSVSCVGCANKNKQYLTLASDCMEVAPDSAMLILEKVENIEEESHSQQAFFALLWTQARHKCHLPLGNDSLINIATNFYMRNEKNHLAAKALLYKGLVHKQRKEVEKAAEAFALSEQWFEEVEDDQYKALLYNHYGALMIGERNYEDALEYLKKSYHFKLKGDSIHYIMSACGAIANTFIYLGKSDSANLYFEKGLQYKDKVPARNLFLFLQNYANFLRKSGEYAKTEDLLLECEQHITGEQRYSLYSSLATLYYETKDYAKALAYAERMQKSTDSLIMRGYYLHLYRIHTKLENKDVAHNCYKRYTDIHDALQARLKTKEVAVIPHQVEKRMLAEKEKTGQIQRRWLMRAIVVLALIAMIVYGIQRAKHKREQKEMAWEIEAAENVHQKERTHMQQVLTEKNVKIGNLKSIISNKNNKIARIETEKEMQAERIDELEKSVTNLRKEEQEALQMGQSLKEELQQQQQRQEALEGKIMELEREQRINYLIKCSARHPENEKLKALLELLKGNESSNIKNSECLCLLGTLTDMIYPNISARITAQVKNENKQAICYLTALGFDHNVGTIQKIVPLNEKTIRKYHKECRQLVDSLIG